MEIRFLELFLIIFLGIRVVTNEPIIGSIYYEYIIFALILGHFLCDTYRIDISENKTILFKRILFSKIYEISDIVRITRGNKLDSIVFRNGVRRLSPFLTDIPGLKATLKEMNPKIELSDDTQNPGHVTKSILGILIVFILFWVGMIGYFLYIYKN
jgi:hypothetical protein